MDSLHAASAEYARADIFLSVDNDFSKIIDKSLVRIDNPVHWFMEETNNE